MTEPIPLTADDVQVNLDVLKTQVPTLEEQMFSTCMATWNGDQYVGYDFVATLFVAPIRVKILSVGLAWDYHNQSASDSNYWRIRLRAGDNTEPYRYIAARSTQTTGAETNGGILARVAWTFDAAAWSDSELAPGDLLQLHCTRHGDPADMRFPCTVTVRYAAM